MNKKFLKNNFFIIVFGISFIAFTIGFGISKLIPKQTEDTMVSREEISGESELVSTSEETASSLQNKTADSEAKNSETKAPETETAIFTKAEHEYLDGALFIGDSRTDTLASYAGWDKTVFWVKTGLTIWDVLDEKIAKVQGKKATVKKALKEKQFDKIYIMLGVNELGTGSSDDFYNQYKKVIDYIKKTQPQSIIYIQSIIHVTNEKREHSDYINNKNIDLRNSKIIKLADNKQVYWLDLNEIFDKKGKNELNKKYTSDGVHIIPKFIPVWEEYLLTHVVKK